MLGCPGPAHTPLPLGHVLAVPPHAETQELHGLLRLKLLGELEQPHPPVPGPGTDGQPFHLPLRRQQTGRLTRLLDLDAVLESWIVREAQDLSRFL